MSAPTGTLAERRRALVAQSDQDRAALANIFGGLERRFAVADRVVRTVQGIEHHRVLVGAVAAGLLFAPGFVRKWIGRAATFLPLGIAVFKLISARRESSRDD